MRKLIVTLIGIIILILENSIFNYLKIFDISINISIIYICIISLFVKDNEGAFIGLVIGIFKDILIGSILGMNGITYFIIGYLYGKLRDKIFKERMVTIAILIYTAVVFECIVNLMISKNILNNREFLFALLHSLILIPMLNAFIGALVSNKLINFVKKLEYM